MLNDKIGSSRENKTKRKESGIWNLDMKCCNPVMPVWKKHE